MYFNQMCVGWTTADPLPTSGNTFCGFDTFDCYGTIDGTYAEWSCAAAIPCERFCDSVGQATGWSPPYLGSALHFTRAAVPEYRETTNCKAGIGFGTYYYAMAPGNQWGVDEVAVVIY